MLAPRKKSYDQPRQHNKSRDITLPTKVCIVKVMVFSAVMYGCESWTVKKVECQIIDAFKLWCWRRLLRVLWTARRSNQSILKEINPEYSLEWLMSKLKLQYFGYLMWTTDSLEKSLMLGKIEGRRRRRVRGRDSSYPTTNPGTPAPGATRNAKTQAAKDARQSISSTVWTERGQDSLSK